MFESAVLAETGGVRRSYSMSASLITQAAVVGSLLVASIWVVEPLPTVPLPKPLPPFRHVPLVPVDQVVRNANQRTTNLSLPRLLQPSILRAPSRIPPDVATIVDDVPPGLMPGTGSTRGGFGAEAGVPFGVGEPITRTPPAPAPAKEAKPPAAPTRLAVGGDVLQAKLMRQVTPVYPPLARSTRISGVVRLEGVIGTDGRIQQLRVVNGHPMLVHAALDAVQQWVYRPTLLNGKPVEVAAPIEVRFVLGQ